LSVCHHHAGTAKAIAVELACRLTGWTHRAIGANHGGISGAAVSVARRRIREALAAEANLVERLLAELAREGTSPKVIVKVWPRFPGTLVFDLPPLKAGE
jgi:hypothetical protein